MYAVITEADGALELSIQVPPEALTPKQARTLLTALEPLLATLRDRAGTSQEVVKGADDQAVLTLPVGRPRGGRAMASTGQTEGRANAPGR